MSTANSCGFWEAGIVNWGRQGGKFGKSCPVKSPIGSGRQGGRFPISGWAKEPIHSTLIL